MTRILLTGKTGQLGWELLEALAPLGDIAALGRAEMDLSDETSIRRAIRDIRPRVIVNAAGYTTVDKAEDEPDLAMRINATAPGVMAEEAKRLGALLVHFSTDYVYDGALERPYVEDDPPNPLNVYGASKLAGERAIEAVGGAHLILRTSWIYSARGTNFVLTILRLAREKPEVPVVDDQIGSPTWVRVLADATVRVLRARDSTRDTNGIYHLSASGHTSRHEFARAIISRARETSGIAHGWGRIRPISSEQYPLPATRPKNVATSKEKVKRVFDIELPPWKRQLEDFFRSFASAAMAITVTGSDEH